MTVTMARIPRVKLQQRGIFLFILGFYLQARSAYCGPYFPVVQLYTSVQPRSTLTFHISE